jgi:hypothetical protein
VYNQRHPPHPELPSHVASGPRAWLGTSTSHKNRQHNVAAGLAGTRVLATGAPTIANDDGCLQFPANFGAAVTAALRRSGTNARVVRGVSRCHRSRLSTLLRLAAQDLLPSREFRLLVRRVRRLAFQHQLPGPRHLRSTAPLRVHGKRIALPLVKQEKGQLRKGRLDVPGCKSG